MDDGGPALFRLVRFWSRRWARGVAVDVGPATSLPQYVLVVDAVDALHRGEVEPAVGDVARELGLDRSGASRMVAAATDQGYLEQHRSRVDARRRSLTLTTTGHALLEESHRWQRAKFLELTASWSATDRARFAGYLERLARDVGA